MSRSQPRIVRKDPNCRSRVAELLEIGEGIPLLLVHAPHLESEALSAKGAGSRGIHDVSDRILDGITSPPVPCLAQLSKSI